MSGFQTDFAVQARPGPAGWRCWVGKTASQNKTWTTWTRGSWSPLPHLHSLAGLAITRQQLYISTFIILLFNREQRATTCTRLAWMLCWISGVEQGSTGLSCDTGLRATKWARHCVRIITYFSLPAQRMLRWEMTVTVMCLCFWGILF